MIKCRQLMGVEILGYGMVIDLVMRKGDTNNMNVLEKILEEIENRESYHEELLFQRDNYEMQKMYCTEELGWVKEIIRSHMDEVTNMSGKRLIDEQPIVYVNDGWIPVSERLPEEHDSIFARFKGTDKWDDAMFEKISDSVNVTVEFECGARETKVSCTVDGKWRCEKEPVKKTVIAWQPLPEAYKGG